MVHRFSVGRDIHAQPNGAPLRREKSEALYGPNSRIKQENVEIFGVG